MTSSKQQPVALIVGAGDHLGSAIARRFASEGFHIVATRRRGDLGPLVEEIEAAGGFATGLHSDARDEDEVKRLVDSIEGEFGPLEVCVFNVGGNVSFPILETTSRVYRKVWEMCAFGGFLVGRESARVMLSRGHGTILFTGATASLRGKDGFAAFAGGKHALRALAESMARELGPQGIHVGHIVIDGPIENDNSRKLFPQVYADRLADGILQPDDIAEAYWNIHNQNRNAWTFEVDVRPYLEPW
jgi:NAD(P)-dependent dehydrogenase (short-subunit alcohol dehydrogenase family)